MNFLSPSAHRRRFFAWIVVSLWWPLALLAAPPALELSGTYGVNIHRGALQKGDLGRIKQAGFDWVRVDLAWARTEKICGRYDFTDFDAFFHELEAAGLHALVILDYGNPLYADAEDKFPFASRVGTDEFRQAYAAWTAAAVQHFTGRGFLWELWNEPNEKTFWPPRPDPAAYVALVRPACAEIRKVAPNERILGPASSEVALPFLERCLQLGMLNYWSAVSVHPYRKTTPETVAADYAKLRTLIARYLPAGQTAPIICGEWGYSTATPGMDDDKQADYLTRMFRLNRQEKIPLTIWYDWRDNGDDPTEKEHRFGLVRRSLSAEFEPKPAYFAAQRAVAEQQSSAQ